MTVERLSPENLATTGPDAKGQIARHIESDFRIRSGLCPNGCGLMGACSYGQECPACSFSCNTAAETGLTN